MDRPPPAPRPGPPSRGGPTRRGPARWALPGAALLACLAAAPVLTALWAAAPPRPPGGQPGPEPSAWERLVAGAEELERRARRALDDLEASAQPRAVPTGLFTFGVGEDGRALKAPLAPDAPVPARVALLIHGLDDPGDIWLDLAPALAGAGVTPVAFEYRNDGPAAAAADELAAALRGLRARGVARVDLVAHSMGGLVARDVLTRPGVYAGRAAGHGDLPEVGRLVMLGTPHRGSALARLRALTEVREMLMRWADDKNKDVRVLLGFLTDGLGDAGKDLLPGSAYLADLNARPAPAGVEMTCVVGVLAAPPRAADLEWIARTPLLKELVGPGEAAAISDALGDLASTIGDGCVTAESATLEGVGDVVRIEASHRGMLRKMQIEQLARRAAGEPEHDTPPGVEVVLDRLVGGEGEGK